VPAFDEVLAFARGRVGVYVDSKQVSAADMITALARHEMQDHVVVYGALSYLKEIAALRPTVK
jgi:glycerophosphoryl diester phosphodiesterase